MFNEESKVVLTIQLEGTQGATASNSSSKEEINKMKMSPVIKDPSKVKNLPKNFYEGDKKFNPTPVKSCSKRLVLGYTALSYFISDSCPSGVNKKIWDRLNETQRLEYHLASIAYPSKIWSYEVIE